MHSRRVALMVPTSRPPTNINASFLSSRVRTRSILPSVVPMVTPTNAVRSLPLCSYLAVPWCGRCCKAQPPHPLPSVVARLVRYSSSNIHFLSPLMAGFRTNAGSCSSSRVRMQSIAVVSYHDEGAPPSWHRAGAAKLHYLTSPAPSRDSSGNPPPSSR